MNVDWLREIPLLSDSSDADLEILAVAFHKEEYSPGTILFREGEKGDRFALVLRGEVEIIQALETTEERLLATIGPGDFLGEMSLLDPSGLRSASARARGAIVWAQMTRQDFTFLLERQPSLAQRLLQEIVLRLSRYESGTLQDLKAKNQALAQAYYDLQQAQSALIEMEKLEHELEIAREIQKSILPKLIPDVSGWLITTHWQPARSVSGDFYDIFPYPDGRLGLLIADVSGKGVPAALVMAITCSMLRAVASSEISPGALLEQVNQLLYPYMPGNKFVTCLYGVLEPTSGVFRFANAGHNLPVKISINGVQEIRATGMPLGLMPGMTYEENEALLQPEEGLLLYTDGMVEAHNETNEMFGLPRLNHCLAEVTRGSNVIDYLLDSLAQFTGPDWEQEDDVTFVLLTNSSSK
jgi:serine phosphatase RsbU (regulator of sigma subunit)